MRPKFAFEPLLFHNWVSVKNMKYQVVPGMRRAEVSKYDMAEGNSLIIGNGIAGELEKNQLK